MQLCNVHVTRAAMCVGEDGGVDVCVCGEVCWGEGGGEGLGSS